MAIWLIAKSVLLEAVRRKEVYSVVFMACLLIALIMTIDFFKIEGLNKFYREAALKIMGLSSALAVIFLACRQLPREFETGTIQTILAKPISRWVFLSGKWLGVLLSGTFCLCLFMSVYVVGTFYLGGTVPWALFFQHFFLQLTLFLLLSSLCFWLSLFLTLDAAIAVACLLYLLASILMNATNFLYYESGPAGKAAILAITYTVPQIELFDLSGKVVHADVWSPIGFSTMTALCAYGVFYAVLYFGLAWWTFNRRRI